MTMTTTEWAHRDILTNGIRMHYVTQGEGPLVVLLHGFPEFWYSWRSQIPFLAGLGYRVIAPDLRGYNDTDKPKSGYDVSTLLRDIEGLIKGLGYEKATIVGHDWGGALMWLFGLSYPHMTERLIGLNAPPPWTFSRLLRTPEQLRKSWYIFAFQLPFVPELSLGRNHCEPIAKMLYASAVQKSAFPDDVLALYRDAMSKPGALTAAINYYRSLWRGGGLGKTSNDKRTIEQPTLLIWGEQDIALGIEMTYGLEQWVPQIEVRRLPDSGHWVQQEKPEQVNQLMKNFLTHE
ncbi:alpha/beta fold hydrolase [Ktedonospora formicarum]|uniref:Epoxide hydrolase n=1 Tax=Ktedonospora formicarum TaxID=2778364 RepID=A0A8J3HV25_9CHLR|nr:alpha/beta hydrolase [Ktedonospora formicarum]GHO44582.1 epoxide hydrolase [Ktedonospora formicarum]